MKQIVIIGNGISGVTAARYIRKNSNHKILLISKESPYFFSRTALLYVFMGHMKFEHIQPYENWFWKKNNIDLLQAHVTQINTDEKEIVLDNGQTISFDDLIIATGSKPNVFPWPGVDLKGISGLYHKQDLEYIEKIAPTVKRAVIIGGGLIGIELAEMLRSRNIQVTFLVRENSFWNNVLPKEESALLNNHILEHHIDLRLATELKQIHGNKNNEVISIETTTGEIIPCEFVGLTVGVSPNINWLKGSGIETNRGILVNEKLQTNHPHIYAIGDCAEIQKPAPGRRPIEAVWYTGRIMGKTLAKTICGNPTNYKPGNWFNSAKFLDVEYQTYGTVKSTIQENEKHFYWQHPSQNIAVRFNYHIETKIFIGMNSFGMRWRHHVFDQWINEGKDIYYIMKHLKTATFDPEFYAKHEEVIIEAFNQKNQTTISLQKKSWKQLLKLVK